MAEDAQGGGARAAGAEGRGKISFCKSGAGKETAASKYEIDWQRTIVSRFKHFRVGPEDGSSAISDFFHSLLLITTVTAKVDPERPVRVRAGKAEGFGRGDGASGRPAHSGVACRVARRGGRGRGGGGRASNSSSLPHGSGTADQVAHQAHLPASFCDPSFRPFHEARFRLLCWLPQVVLVVTEASFETTSSCFRLAASPCWPSSHL